MKKQSWLIIFGIVLAAHIAGIVSGNLVLQQVSKPLLMPVLIGYFLVVTASQQTGLKKWVLLALFFSWAGDVLLMFQPKDDLFFLLGLSAFLLAHIFYIVFFHQLRMQENIKSNPWLLLLVVIYYAVLISWLSPWLGTMKIPVRIYGIVISFMLMLALHLLSLKDKRSGGCLAVGALLFVLSDSVLAINKFYLPFEAAGIIIMLTYGAAQFFITEGASLYIRSGNTH